MTDIDRSDPSQNREGVLFLLDHFPRVWTSLQEFESRLCRALKNEGYLPVLVFSEECRPELKEKYEAVGAIVLASNYQNGRIEYWSLIKRLVSKYNIRTVYIDSFPYSGLMPWLARTRGIRRILHCNGDSGAPRSSGLKRVAVKIHHRFLSWPTRRFVTWSRFVKEQMLATGMPDSKIGVVYGGIDTSRFKAHPDARKRWIGLHSIPEEDVIISTISFLRGFKNPQIIVEACGLVAKHGAPFQLFVAGDGELLPVLQERCRQLGIAERVHWLGKFPEPEVLLAATDIFVLASVGEAFGFVTVEALACGVPVVSSRSGATPELVEDGVTGLLATPLDPASFADALEQLIRNSNLRRRMAERGRIVVRERFQVDMAVENWMREFERAGLKMKTCR